MTYDEVLNAVLAELARVMNREVDVVRADLQRAGGNWPCDSLLLTEAVVGLEEELGIELPMDETTAKSLKSVRGLAKRFHELLEQGEGTDG